MQMFHDVDALVAWRIYGGIQEATMDQDEVRQAQSRIEREYLEMPGLSLTEPQARRLLGLPRDLCEAALKGLARQDVLVETAHGTFLRPYVDAWRQPR
jgi:hypothetical protein